MKTKISPTVVGAFVLGAFALGVLALLTFGGLSLFSKPERFIIYFDESIHGLDLGSPVKLRGVRVGRVVDLSIRYDPATNRSVAAVVCELNHDKITDNQGRPIDVSDREGLQNLVDRGLRAQLGIAGLATGLLFVELDFYNPHRYPDTNMNTATSVKYVTVPSLPSALTALQANTESLLGKMQQIDFQGLSDELKSLLEETRMRIQGVDLKGLAEQWKRTGQSVDTVARSPEFARALVNLNATLESLRGAIVRIDAQVDSNGHDLRAALAQTRETLQSFNAAAVTARRFIDTQQNLGADADRAFSRLGDAAESVQRLADFLERNPNALISGRKLP